MSDSAVDSECWESEGPRAHWVRELIRVPAWSFAGTPRTRSHDEAFAIPRVLVQFWHDSNALPPDVRRCLDSWRPLERRGFTRLLFGYQSGRDYIERLYGARYVEAYERCHHQAMRCDYFRLCYLLAEGGFYVDADEVFLGANFEWLFRDSRLKTQPLCFDRTTQSMIPANRFWLVSNPPATWYHYINNNPLITPAGHPILRRALERSTQRLLSTSKPLDIQATTGPGNFTASLIQHVLETDQLRAPRDFLLLSNWDGIANCPWPLSYRFDDRNWRLWNPHMAP